MFSFLKSDPVKSMRKDYYNKLELAMLAQRNGDMERYAFLSKEANELHQKLENYKRKNT
jgi:hypothetical protein